MTQEEIYSKTETLANGCVVWLGATNNGFPIVTQQRIKVQRLVMNATNEQQVFATCKNKRCLNKEHLVLFKPRKEETTMDREEVILHTAFNRHPLRWIDYAETEKILASEENECTVSKELLLKLLQAIQTNDGTIKSMKISEDKLRQAREYIK